MGAGLYGEPGEKVLGFKDEDEINGMPIGKVFEATLNEKGYPAGDPTRIGVPYNPNPEPWYTLEEAEQMAADKGLRLIQV